VKSNYLIFALLFLKKQSLQMILPAKAMGASLWRAGFALTPVRLPG